jgi:hypothetical protein
MDIRLPLGIIFSLYGVILAGTGLLAQQNGSLGININLLWGLVLLAFGVVMLLLAWFGKKRVRGTQ